VHVRVAFLLTLAGVGAVLSSGVLHGQGRGGPAWTTSQGDAQRSAWIRTDGKLSIEAMQKPGFRFLWKAALDNRVRQLHNLTQPITLTNIISYKGFKALVFVGGSNDTVFSIDYDLNRMFWTRRLGAAGPASAATLSCPGALTTITRQTNIAPAATPGRGLPVGAGSPSAGRGGGGGAGLGGGRGAANTTIAVGSSGMLHLLNPQTGEDTAPPVKFLPANVTASGAILIDEVVYAATVGNCGGSEDGVYAIDLSASGSSAVIHWTAQGAPIVGTAGPAFGSDGTVFVATGTGSGTADTVVALDRKTLTLKDSFRAASPFASSPVVFPYGEREYVAVANRDGRLYLLDSTAMARAPTMSAAYTNGAFATGALATWEDATGTRWILVPISGAPTAGSGFTTTGTITNGAVVAFKVVEQAGKMALQPAWVSRDLTSPVAPMVINGVVFALSTGESRDSGTPAQRAQRSSPAVLYALDGTTGSEYWNSGPTITSFVHELSPSGSDSQVYVVTYDGTLYAFGMPMER
jgi:hypothetical protein